MGGRQAGGKRLEPARERDLGRAIQKRWMLFMEIEWGSWWEGIFGRRSIVDLFPVCRLVSLKMVHQASGLVAQCFFHHPVSFCYWLIAGRLTTWPPSQ